MDIKKNHEVIIADNDYLYREGINIQKNEILVGSSITSYNIPFPETVYFRLKKYKFSGLIPMSGFLIGNYFSVAVYLETEEI